MHIVSPKLINQFSIATFSSIVILLIALLPIASNAASYTVSTTDDEADSSPLCLTGSSINCSLREAIVEANSNPGVDTITVPAGSYILSAGEINVTDASGVIITGAGTGSTTIDGNDTNRMFDVTGSLTLSDATLYNGGEVDAWGGAIRATGTLTIDNVVFDDNDAAQLFDFSVGGAIGCNTASGDITITNSTFTANGTGATSYGGAVGALNCDISIENSTFDGNQSQTGGALFIQHSGSGSDTLISETTFINNSSPYNGGGIFFWDTFDVVFEQSLVSNNSAGSSGGGIYSRGEAEITNSIIEGNTADRHGGGIFVADNVFANVKIAHSTIVQNTSNDDDSSGGDGGGIYLDGGSASATINGSIIASNTAVSASGADCSASSGLASNDYNILGDSASCTFTAGTNDVLDPTAVSPFATATLVDNGGSIQTLNPDNGDVKDAVPPTNCLDAAGASLAVDARGMSRPDNTNCDIGAYEFDQTNPVISGITGVDTIECSVDTWTNAGATVTDNHATGLMASTSDTVDTTIVGEQTVTYISGADLEGNIGTADRTVTVQDTTAPVVNIIGESGVTVLEGGTYTELGASVTDSCDTTVSAIIGGDVVDTSEQGEYTVTYTATDASGNTTEASRSVAIVSGIENNEPIEEPVVTVTTNGKYVKVFEGDTLVSKKKIRGKKLKKKYRKLQVKNIYKNKGYRNVVVLTAGKLKSNVTVFRLTKNNQLKKKVKRSFDSSNRGKLKLTVKKGKKRIIAQVGSGDDTTVQKYKLTKKGKLKAL